MLYIYVSYFFVTLFALAYASVLGSVVYCKAFRKSNPAVTFIHDLVLSANVDESADAALHAHAAAGDSGIVDNKSRRDPEPSIPSSSSIQ